MPRSLEGTASVIIPAIRNEPLLERCVRECAKKCENAEILVVLDQAEGAESLREHARILVSGPLTIAAKRNLGARKSRAAFIAFIDSDAYPEEGWLGNAVMHLRENPELGAVGGPNVSPPEQSNSEKIVGFALRSVLVTGSGNFRKTIRPARIVSDLPSCNLVVRRQEYLDTGGMDEALFTGEDMDFCRRLVERDRKILYSPDVLVYHKNRNLRQFVNQRLTYGSSVISLLRNGFQINLFLLLLPAIFILFILSAPLMLFWPFWGGVYLGVMTAYLALLTVESIRQTDSPRSFPGTFLAIAIGNLVPGIGTFARALNFLPDLRRIYRNDS